MEIPKASQEDKEGSGPYFVMVTARVCVLCEFCGEAPGPVRAFSMIWES